jgi:hypothetical protein
MPVPKPANVPVDCPDVNTQPSGDVAVTRWTTALAK